MKPRHVLNAILFGLSFLAVGWFIIFYGAWFVPNAPLRWAAALIALPIGAYISFWVIPPRRASIGVFALPNTWIVKTGRMLFVALIVWLLLAQSIPTAITNSLGTTRTMQDTVIHFYRSTRSCGQRLILSTVNPTFGGYCGAGSRNEFYSGQPVVITYKTSVLGLSVLGFQPARANSSFKPKPLRGSA